MKLEFFYALLIFYQNNFPSLKCRFFSDDVFTGVKAGQPVTHIRSTNSKPQPSNQSILDGQNQVPSCIFSCSKSHLLGI